MYPNTYTLMHYYFYFEKNSQVRSIPGVRAVQHATRSILVRVRFGWGWGEGESTMRTIIMYVRDRIRVRMSMRMRMALVKQ